jgi:predicted nucleic acid-binding protein
MGGHIYAELELDGHPIGLRDTFIAATALTRKYSVTTRNTEHFKKVKDLTEITN